MSVFCKICKRNIQLKINANTGTLHYPCQCGNIEPANPEYTLISEISTRSININEYYTTFIQTASHDPTNTKIMKDCTKCGLNYMTQILLGPDLTIIYSCKCGNIIK